MGLLLYNWNYLTCCCQIYMKGLKGLLCFCTPLAPDQYSPGWGPSQSTEHALKMQAYIGRWTRFLRYMSMPVTSGSYTCRSLSHRWLLINWLNWVNELKGEQQIIVELDEWKCDWMCRVYLKVLILRKSFLNEWRAKGIIIFYLCLL